MQNIISRGKCVNEAIQLGIELLDTTKSEVNIEIIQYESKGILGIGSKPAIVKLTKLEPNQQEISKLQDPLDLVEEFLSEKLEGVSGTAKKPFPNEPDVIKVNVENETDSLEGKVWVKAGQLYSKSSPEKFPIVTVNEGITVYKNNVRVLEQTIIMLENEIYQIKLEDEEIETKWHVAMDDHKLKVSLDVVPGYKMIRTIPDIQPEPHIELKAVERKVIHNTLSYGDIMHKLESLGVINGINQQEVLKALESTEPSTFEIATGIPPRPGKDGWIEIKVKMDTQNGPKEKKDGRVDYREINTIPSIERGKIIAIIHPPIAGEKGYSVLNEPIPAKQTLPIVLKVGKGAMTLDDKLVATESGRPFIEQRGQLVKVNVMPKLNHVGNVDLSSGNIHFMGDIEIFGNVEERMMVEAEGDIIVHQSVNMAKLTSSGAIVTYGNIINSEISAGKNNLLITELGHLLGNLYQLTEKIIAVITQLSNSPAFKANDISRGGLQALIRILLQKKFMNFSPLAKKYVDVVRKGEEYLADDGWKEIAISLSHLFLSLSNEVVSIERIIQLSQKMKELHQLSITPVEPDSYVTIPNALNSRIYCSGNVLILGQGCITSKIHAGGMLKISGIIRGGEVYGRLGAEINEAGSESGTSTIIAVSSDQKIHIKKVMEGTTIKIGNIKYTFKETKYHVTASLDSDERIIFT